MELLWLPVPLQSITVEKSQRQVLETTGHIISVVRKQRSRNACLCSAHFLYSHTEAYRMAPLTVGSASHPNELNGQAHTDTLTGHSDLDNPSLRHSTKVILDCVKMTITAITLSFPLPLPLSSSTSILLEFPLYHFPAGTHSSNAY